MAQPKNLLAVLEEIGLKEHEAALYLTANVLGRSTVLSLSRAAKIKRGTVYETLPRLIERGLLREIMIDEKRFFVAEDPRFVASNFHQRVKNLEQALPQFLALQNANTKKPKVTYFEGESEVWKIYEDTLATGLPILSYTSVTGVYEHLDPRRIDDYFTRRTEKKIPIRVLAVDSPESRKWAAQAQKYLRDMRIVPAGQYAFSADVEIYGDKVAIISYIDGLFGIILESPQISQLQRWAFELMWQAAEKVRSIS
ncbi:MAG: hypothetical protein HY092_04045 [Candidatus Kerfeldbacteria bacterium]|nr:hypothetical protein [Candidatus Kerfeldbacteria bacterium]